jgi:hypothetical protein
MDEINAKCPFLGFADDPSTCTSYPSYLNVCYKARPQDVPNLRYQQEYCLDVNHVHCSVLWQMKKNPLPKMIRATSGQFLRQRSLNWKIIPLFFLLAALAFTGFTLITRNQAGPTSDLSDTETGVMELLASAGDSQWTRTPTPTVYMTETPSSLELTRTAFVVQQLSATPSPTLTLTPTVTNTPQPVVNVAPTSKPKKQNTPKPAETPIPIPIGGS